jgi:hypothetical protein
VEQHKRFAFYAQYCADNYKRAAESLKVAKQKKQVRIEAEAKILFKELPKEEAEEIEDVELNEQELLELDAAVDAQLSEEVNAMQTVQVEDLVVEIPFEVGLGLKAIQAVETPTTISTSQLMVAATFASDLALLKRIFNHEVLNLAFSTALADFDPVKRSKKLTVEYKDKQYDEAVRKEEAGEVDACLTYGESTVQSFIGLIEQVQKYVPFTADSSFFDIGSGLGK